MRRDAAQNGLNATLIGSTDARRLFAPQVLRGGDLQIPNRHFLARLEASVTSTKYTPEVRFNRHVWEARPFVSIISALVQAKS
jgi:hypothetical protein